jgi:hypothetical protein
LNALNLKDELKLIIKVNEFRKVELLAPPLFRYPNIL